MTPMYNETMIERFWGRVNKKSENECWLWTDTISKSECRGIFRYQEPNGKWTLYSAHRFSYELRHGPIPTNGEIIQSCGIKHCVNPDHLQLQNGSIEARFWSKVQKQDGNECWIWNGSFNDKGYGQFNTGKKPSERAHRFSYILTYGHIPDGLCVCHKCDNPKCVRPDHLFLGTRKDNNRDRANKGRTRLAGLVGEQIGTAKLTNEEVREIKRLLALGWKPVDIINKIPIATKYTISDIKRGKSWRHIA